MSRKPSRAETKKIKQQIKDDERLIELLKARGRMTDEDEVAMKKSLENDDDVIWGAEATLAFIANPRGWRQQECKECDMLFATDYKFITYCSNSCRVKALERSGLTWNPHKSFEERWGKVIPRVVPPQALLILNETQQSQPQQEDQPEIHTDPEPIRERTDPHANLDLERELSMILGL